MEGLDAPALVQAQPEPVRVNVGGAAPLAEPLERKGKVGFFGAVHSQDLAHGGGEGGGSGKRAALVPSNGDEKEAFESFEGGVRRGGIGAALLRVKASAVERLFKSLVT
jgi:hypothetical protein